MGRSILVITHFIKNRYHTMEFYMRNLFKYPGFIVIVMVIEFFAVSCTTTDFKSNLAGEYNLLPKIAGKNFLVLGLVSVSATETRVTSPLSLQTTITGESVTFDLLMKEAQNLYPDVTDIINVRIDKNDNGTRGVFTWLIGGTTTIIYYGNALAIKYTPEALEEVSKALEGRSSDLSGNISGQSFLDKIFGGF